MSEQIVGYRVSVYEDQSYAVAYTKVFRQTAEDPLGYRIGHALRAAELHAEQMRETWPGRRVEVDCIWGRGA